MDGTANKKWAFSTTAQKWKVKLLNMEEANNMKPVAASARPFSGTDPLPPCGRRSTENIANS
jgi:hypothetical protein